MDTALRKAYSNVDQIGKEYMDAKRYMVQRGEIDPHEIFQNELLLKQTDRTGAFAVETCGKIAKLRESPYFARIDFQGIESKEVLKYYIGRFCAKGEWIKKRFHAYGKDSIKHRLERVAEDIHDRFQTDNIMQDEIPRVKMILKSLTSMLTIKNSFSLYKDFYKKRVWQNYLPCR